MKNSLVMKMRIAVLLLILFTGIVLGSTTPVEITLRKGINFICLPGNPVNSDAQSLFGSDVDVSEWIGSAFHATTRVVGGQPYRVDSHEGRTVTILAEESDTVTAPPELRPGWNLLGGTHAHTIRQTVSESSALWDWNNRWLRVDSDDEIIRWRAYWCYVGDHDLAADSPPLPSRESRDSRETGQRDALTDHISQIDLAVVLSLTNAFEMFVFGLDSEAFDPDPNRPEWFDRLDGALPPAPFVYSKVATTDNGVDDYFMDIRRSDPSKETFTWKVAITIAEGMSDVVMSWDRNQFLPDGKVYNAGFRMAELRGENGEILADFRFDHEITFTEHQAIYLILSQSISNTPPQLRNDRYTVFRNRDSRPLDVLSNDFDVDGNALQFVLSGGARITTARGGIAMIESGNKTIVYTPPSSFQSTPGNVETFDSFTYAVTDGERSSSATVFLEVLDNAVTVERDIYWEVTLGSGSATPRLVVGYRIDVRSNVRSRIENLDVKEYFPLFDNGLGVYSISEHGGGNPDIWGNQLPSQFAQDGGLAGYTMRWSKPFANPINFYYHLDGRSEDKVLKALTGQLRYSISGTSAVTIPIIGKTTFRPYLNSEHDIVARISGQPSGPQIITQYRFRWVDGDGKAIRLSPWTTGLEDRLGRDAGGHGIISCLVDKRLGSFGNGVPLYSTNVAIYNTIPTVRGAVYYVDEDATRDIVLVADDPDSNDTVDITVNPTVNGTLASRETTDSSVALTYTPNPNFSGEDRLTYVATDDANQSATATVTIRILSLPDPPQLTVVDELTLLNGADMGLIGLANFEITDPDLSGNAMSSIASIELIGNTELGSFSASGQSSGSSSITVTPSQMPLTLVVNQPRVFREEFIEVIARDVDGLRSLPAQLKITTGVITQSLTLQPGWNLISFKADPFVPSFTDLFAGNGALPIQSPVWTWDQATGGFRQAQTAVPGKGYWVFINRQVIIDNVLMKALESWDIPVQTGWNLVGPVGFGTSRDAPMGETNGTIWSWNAKEQRFAAASSLESGKSYWLNAEDEIASMELPLP